MQVRGWLARLHQQGKVADHHVEAAAKFESLIYNGYGTKSIAPDRVYIKQAKYHANLSGMRLGRLRQPHSRVLWMALIDERTLFDIGYAMGATSRTGAYRIGLGAIVMALDHAARVL